MGNVDYKKGDVEKFTSMNNDIVVIKNKGK